MIIGISGFAQAGKDSIGQRLTEQHGFQRFAFADKVKEMALRLNAYAPRTDGISLRGVTRLGGWEGAKNYPYIRQLLIDIGEGAREVIGPDVWLDAVVRAIPPHTPVVVTDVRFRNEYDWITDHGEMWRVHRPGYGPVSEGPSENELTPLPFDRHFVNDSDIPTLHLHVDQAMQEIESLAP